MKAIVPLLVLLTLCPTVPVAAKEAPAPAKGPAAVTTTDEGAADPEGFPRPEGTRRKSYSSDRSDDGKRLGELATYHAQTDIDATVKRSREQLAAAGWRAGHRSDSGSGLHRVVIDDWDRPGKDLEVRYYPGRESGSDLWVSMKTYADRVAAASATSTPAPAAMPNLVGKSYRAAADILRTLNQPPGGAKRGLTTTYGPGKPTTDTGKIGTVAEQSPAAGQTLPDGSTVTLVFWVATGPMPNFVGKSRHEVDQALEALKQGPAGTQRVITAVTDRARTTTDFHQVGYVAEQTPAAGVDAPDGSTVTLRYWATGDAMLNLIGMDKTAAQSALNWMQQPPGGPKRSLTVTYGPGKPTTDAGKVGTVAEQSPAAGQTLPDGSTVTLVYWATGDTMPDVVGKNLNAATDMLEPTRRGASGTGHRFKVTHGPGKPTTDPAKVMTVAEQNPAAGQLVADDSTVTLVLWVATGPMPNFVGKSRHEVDQALEALKQGPAGTQRVITAVTDRARTTTDFHQVGYVAEQTPAAGVDAPDGSTVTLRYWAVGDTMLNLIGMDKTEVQSAVNSMDQGPGGTKRGLTLTYGPGKSATDPNKVGTVAEQSPAAGQPLADGSTVTLQLYDSTATPAKSVAPSAAAAEQGPASNAPLVAVPDLSGKRQSEAEALLKQNKLEVAWGPEKPKLSKHAVPTIVGGQSLPAGKLVTRGTTVTLTPLVWSVSVPRVHGSYTEAGQLLAESSLHARRGHTKATMDIRQAGIVLETDPTAGTVVHGDTTVTLVMGAFTGPVPNVVGKTHAEAEMALTGGGHPMPGSRYFLVQKGPDSPTTDRHLAGTVATQDPAAGVVAEDGSTVTLTLWSMSGPMPNVVGQPYSAAEMRLTGKSGPPGGRKFQVQRGPTKLSPSQSRQDEVAEQSPAAGETVTDGALVTLTTWTGRAPVPNVVGQTYADAKGTLSGSDHRPGSARFQVQRGPDSPTTDRHLSGTVATQDPAAGTQVKSDSTVTLNVWEFSGPLPNVVGRPYAEAEATLNGKSGMQSARKFIVQQGPPKVDPGHSHSGIVAEQYPAAGTVVADGSTVTLTTWEKAYPVPDVTGMTYAAAAAKLTGSANPGVHPKFQAQQGPTVLTTDSRLGGAVASQQPAAGEMAADGATITLTMGTWAQPVPNVVGFTLAHARGQLAQLGIAVKTDPTTPTSDAQKDGTVAAQSPAAGTLVPEYATVTLTFYKLTP